MYASVLQWPKTNVLYLGAPKPTAQTQVSMLGVEGNFQWKKGPAGGIEILIPAIPINLIPSTYAWVIKLQNLDN